MIRLDRPTEALRRFLGRHRAETLNIAGILENEPGVEIFVDDEAAPGGVLVRSPWQLYVHAEDGAFLDQLCRELAAQPGPHRFSGVWHPVAERIKARFPLAWDATCRLYVLPDGGQVPLQRPGRDGPFQTQGGIVAVAHLVR